MIAGVPPPRSQATLDAADVSRPVRMVGLLAILALGVCLRLVFAVGPAATDDMRYMRAAATLAQGQPLEIVDHACVRAAFILWLAAWIKLGAGTWGLMISDVALSAAIMVTVFWLALKWTSARAALLSVLWLAVFPLELLCSGLVVSDHLGVLLGLLSAGLTFEALTSRSGGVALRGLGAGCSMALAVSAKEVYVILPVLYLIWAVGWVRPLPAALRRLVGIGLLAAAVFALEHVFFWAWTGDWAYRYHAVARVYTPQRSAQHIGLRELLYYPMQLLGNTGVCGAFGWLLCAAMFRTFGKLRDAHFVVLWTLGFFVFMQYGTSSLHHYQALPKQWRYMQPMVVMAFIPLGHWMVWWWRSRALGRCGTGLISAGIMLSGVAAASQRSAEGFYSEQSLRCLALARSQETGTRWSRVVLPQWVARGTALDLAEQIRGWPKLDLSDGLDAGETALLQSEGTALLVPEVLWHHKHAEPGYVESRRQLTGRARSRPLEDWASPLDRVLGSVPPLRRFAHTAIIGRYYWIPPQPQTVGHHGAPPADL